MDEPNPISVGFSIIKALRVSRPRPRGTADGPDHRALARILEDMDRDGLALLPDRLDELDTYTRSLAACRPNDLSRDAALAYWLNLYNAGALTLAGETFATRQSSVLRLPGAFTRQVVRVAGESLSLNDIEHGKIRRFRDPRIHSALVCGSASCPTLRLEPYDGPGLDAQLDDQMRHFLAAGAAEVVDGRLQLSRVFLWYGADFVRPHRMPTFVPVRRRQVALRLAGWLSTDQQQWLKADKRSVEFQSYDWGLACSVGKPA